jgi:hypothetical protein
MYSVPQYYQTHTPASSIFDFNEKHLYLVNGFNPFNYNFFYSIAADLKLYLSVLVSNTNLLNHVTPHDVTF